MIVTIADIQRIYKSIAVVFLNLVILSAVTLADIAAKTTIAYVLVAMVFVTMCLVVVYHLHLICTARSPLWLKLRAAVTRHYQNTRLTTEAVPSAVNTGLSSHDPHARVTKTVVDLREPLLEEGM